MPTLDDTGVRLVTFHPHRRGSHRSGLQSIAGTIHQHDGLLRLSSWWAPVSYYLVLSAEVVKLADTLSASTRASDASYLAEK